MVVKALASVLFAAVMAQASAASQGAAVPAQVQAGEAVYTRCFACHALTYDRTGPRHCGLFGRKAGSVKGFEYSEAMKRSNIIWGDKTLERFLADPLKTVPGTTMGYAGVPNKQDRADLIAYLRHAGDSPECKRLEAK